MKEKKGIKFIAVEGLAVTDIIEQSKERKAVWRRTGEPAATEGTSLSDPAEIEERRKRREEEEEEYRQRMVAYKTHSRQ